VEGKNFDSQALSRRPPFVVRRKTLVAAGHVTIQSILIVAVGTFVRFKTSSSR